MASNVGVVTKVDILNCIDKVVLERFGPNFILSDAQRDCLLTFLCGKDTLGVMPTGHGKTLVYQLMPLVVKELNNMCFEDYPSSPILLVVSPLTYLIKEQVERCSKFALSAKLVSDDEDELEKLIAGSYNIVFGSPEIYLSEKWRNVLLSEVYRKNVVGVVVDECHTVVKW